MNFPRCVITGAATIKPTPDVRQTLDAATSFRCVSRSRARDGRLLVWTNSSSRGPLEARRREVAWSRSEASVIGAGLRRSRLPHSLRPPATVRGGLALATRPERSPGQRLPRLPLPQGKQMRRPAFGDERGPPRTGDLPSESRGCAQLTADPTRVAGSRLCTAQRVEKLGLIERRLRAGRGVGLFVTPAGHDMAQTCLAREREHEATLRRLLGDERSKTLQTLLTECHATLREACNPQPATPPSTNTARVAYGSRRSGPPVAIGETAASAGSGSRSIVPLAPHSGWT
jgi:hypothetical protein